MSITPGPNNVMVMASGALFGFRKTMPHILGITLGYTAQTMVLSAGLGATFARLPMAQKWLTYVGVAYMVYLALRLLGAGSVFGAQSVRPLSMWEAMLFQAVNPKAWVMAVTTAIVFMPKSGDLGLALVSMAVVLAAVNYPCVSLWAGFGNALRSLLDNERRRALFNAVMAALLAMTALAMLRD